MDIVSPLVPFPTIQNIAVHAFLVDQDVLLQLCRVIVKEIAQRFDSLGDSRGEETFELGQIFRETNERVKRSSLTCIPIQLSRILKIQRRDVDLK